MRATLAKRRNFLFPLLAGLLPVIAVTTAYLINIYQTELSACMPFWSGCISISRAVRSGPGLFLFKTLALPAAVFIAVSWVYITRWIGSDKLATDRMIKIMLWLGICGAVFMALYVINLGLDGSMYRYMRRFGVSIFFGFTAINQLLLVRVLWPVRSRLPAVTLKPVLLFTFVVSLEWLLGVGSTGKHLVVNNPDILDRLENIIEWWFALLLICAFMLLAWILASIKSADD